MTKIYSEVEHDFENCNCERCKEKRQEEKEIYRLLCYPVVCLAIFLSLIPS